MIEPYLLEEGTITKPVDPKGLEPLRELAGQATRVSTHSVDTLVEVRS